MGLMDLLGQVFVHFNNNWEIPRESPYQTEAQLAAERISQRMTIQKKIADEMNEWSVNLYKNNRYLQKIPEQQKQNKYNELCKKYKYDPHSMD